MRIIAGEAKGRRLFAPPGENTRPTSDKLRGSLFNILGAAVQESRVLDLFGGTGALALEAISRGAAFAAIVDLDRAAIKAITRNAAAVSGKEDASRVKILQADYRAAIASLAGQRFDLVFLDPPYRMTGAYADALTRLRAANCLAKNALLLLERARNAEVLLPEGFEHHDTRQYGETAVDFVRERTDAHAGDVCGQF